MKNISAVSTYIPHKTPAGEAPSLRWRVSLRRDGREFICTEFTQGWGLACAARGRLTVAVVEECETGAGARPPEPAEVLASLLLDADCVDGMSFTQWAREYGYSPDSIAAERIYRACRETRDTLAAEFTPEELAALRDSVADYL
jgi:hypothetical protein